MFFGDSLADFGIDLSRILRGCKSSGWLQCRIRWLASSGSPEGQILQIHFLLSAMSVLTISVAVMLAYSIYDLLSVCKYRSRLAQVDYQGLL